MTPQTSRIILALPQPLAFNCSARSARSDSAFCSGSARVQLAVFERLVLILHLRYNSVLESVLSVREGSEFVPLPAVAAAGKCKQLVAISSTTSAVMARVLISSISFCSACLRAMLPAVTAQAIAALSSPLAVLCECLVFCLVRIVGLATTLQRTHSTQTVLGA